MECSHMQTMGMLSPPNLGDLSPQPHPEQLSPNPNTQRRGYISNKKVFWRVVTNGKAVYEGGDEDVGKPQRRGGCGVRIPL